MGATLLVSVLGPVISALMPANVRHGLETITADQTPTAGQLLDALILVAPILILGLAVQCVMAAAVYRLIFRHDDTRFGYLRLGVDELRLMGLTLICFGLAMVLVVALTMASAIVVALASIGGPAMEGFVGGVAWLFSVGILVFVLVRLSLAPVATFAERRLAIFESWTLTRGQFWRLLGAYTLALACIVVIGLLIIVVFFGIAGVIVLMSGGQVADISSFISTDGSSLRGYLSIGVIAYMVVSSVFSALYNAVIAAPGAVAYQQLLGHPPGQPLAAQPEAG
ncbi:hypothetical protein [Phenylobacterium sp.]|uniref:hypothetical protein n=1 Tax=Phenylobacterium sp. TaxID=1871053 RepID=UPI00356382C5